MTPLDTGYDWKCGGVVPDPAVAMPDVRLDILCRIVDAVQAFVRGAPQHDDVTALVMKYAG